MKKIAILTSHPVHYQTALFAEVSRKTNLDVEVFFCWEISDEYFDTEFNRQVDFNIPNLKGIKYKFLKNFSLKPSSGFWGQINPGIVSSIICNKYDAIIVLGWNSITNWIAFIAAFISGTPVLLRGENPLNQERKNGGIKYKIKKIVLSYLFKKIFGFLYIGEQNKLFYKAYGVSEDKLYFAPYAMNNKRLKEEYLRLRDHRSDIRNKYGVAADAKLVLFVGKLIPKKRPEDLLSAFLAAKVKRKELAFVGDGILSDYLKKNAHDNHCASVHFYGFKNQKELPEYYSMADVFVLPSGVGETWGLVVNEAMCFGLPIIVSDVVGCGYDLVTKENGLTFKYKDTEGLKEAIEKILTNNDTQKSMSLASLDIIDRYSYDEDVLSIERALGAIDKKAID